MNNESRLTSRANIWSLTETRLKVLWCIVGSMVIYAFFAIFYVRWWQEEAVERVRRHSAVIASSMWTLEKPGQTAYLELAAEANGYLRVSVLHETGELFLAIDGPVLSAADHFFHAFGLIPFYIIEEPILYDDKPIGRLVVTWPCRVVYELFYVLLFLALVLGVCSLFLKLLDAKKHLEDRVRQRTIALENEVQERKRAEEAQRQQAEHLALHVQNTPLGVIEWDLSFKVVAWNKAAEEIFEYSRSEALGKTASELILPEEEVMSATVVWEDLKAKRGGTHSINANRTKTGKIKTCRWYNTTLTDQANKVVGVASLVLDDTEKVQAELEKSQLQGQLAQAQKLDAIGKLAGGVAHDFNNMLSVILGHAEIATKKVDGASGVGNHLEEISKAAKRSADITSQLLAFARKQTVAPQVVNLNEIVEGMLKMLRRLIGERMYLTWIPAIGLWSVKVDPSQIDQILVNLCVNARDAMTVGMGKITVETCNAVLDDEYCRRHTGFVPGRYVCISVSDNGCGMDKETLSHIFEPFFTTKKVGEGTGLGMATVYGAVKQNNGFIDVCSEVGEGTTVSIYLPPHAVEGIIEEEKQIVPIASGTETILLVEDEALVLKMTGAMLEELGYVVLSAQSPREAIAMVTEQRPNIDLLITDVIMPEMNGRELASMMRAMLPELKCLFTSGYTGQVIASHGVLDKGVQFIQKPFTIKMLAEKVRVALSQAAVAS